MTKQQQSESSDHFTANTSKHLANQVLSSSYSTEAYLCHSQDGSDIYVKGRHIAVAAFCFYLRPQSRMVYKSYIFHAAARVYWPQHSFVSPDDDHSADWAVLSNCSIIWNYLSLLVHTHTHGKIRLHKRRERRFLFTRKNI